MAKLFKKKTPLVVTWAITYRCNSRCKYCGIWKIKSEELTTKQVFSIIDEMDKLGTKRIMFSGGEPLLREDIGEIIDYCKKHSIDVGLNSNGMLVSKRIKELKNLGVLILSLDGCEKTHNFLRGDGSYKKVIEAIETAKKYNIKTRLTTVITKHNLKEIDFVLALAKKYDISVNFQPATVIQDWDIKDILFTQKQFSKIMVDLIVKKKGGNKQIGNSLVGLKQFRNWKNIECSAGLLYCRIEANGDLCSCFRVKDSRTLNCVKVGLKKAFDSLKHPNCNTWCCAGMVELNLIFNLNPRAIFNGLLKWI